MRDDEYRKIILEKTENIVYLVDIDTYQLLYINKFCMDLFGIKKAEEYRGKLCYKILRGSETPCSFCNNERLRKEKTCTWMHYNEMLKHYFVVYDKLIEMEGESGIRLEIANDVTEIENQRIELNNKLSDEEAIVRCIQALAENNDMEIAIGELLSIIANFYGSTRAYIFELDFDTKTFNNTYEWCAPGISHKAKSQQGIPNSAIDICIPYFNEHGLLYISSLEGGMDDESEEYKMLRAQGLESLLAVPLKEKGTIIGLIGVDNPTEKTDNPHFLISIGCFIINDIQKRRMTARLKQTSYVDSLTGLWNRNKYIIRLQELEKNGYESLGIVYADLNGLKAANDTYGHQYGDLLLERAASLICQYFKDWVFRIGGDEFVVLCENIVQDEFYTRVDRLREMAKADEKVSISIGANWDCAEKNIMSQINQADDLMYIEKQVYYKDALQMSHKIRSEPSKQLLTDIQNNLYLVYLQPKVELKTGNIVGAEALIRKKSPSGELILPDQFIPLYESGGIVRHIDFFVLEKVCEILARWKFQGRPLFKIAVNFSRVTLQEHDIVEKLQRVCEKYQIETEHLIVEITTGKTNVESERLIPLTWDLLKAGFSVSMDDFGTQYFNMSLLSAINFNELKLDKSLIDSISDNSKSQAILEHTIRMCKDLNNSALVAEGIETMGQVNVLKNFNCNYGQGYFYSGALPVEEFENQYIDHMGFYG